LLRIGRVVFILGWSVEKKRGGKERVLEAAKKKKKEKKKPPAAAPRVPRKGIRIHDP